MISNTSNTHEWLKTSLDYFGKWSDSYNQWAARRSWATHPIFYERTRFVH